MLSQTVARAASQIEVAPGVALRVYLSVNATKRQVGEVHRALIRLAGPSRPVRLVKGAGNRFEVVFSSLDDLTALHSKVRALSNMAAFAGVDVLPNELPNASEQLSHLQESVC